MKIYTKEEWSKEQYKGRWEDCPFHRSRVEAGELHPYYIGRRNVMVNEGRGPCLITEGLHFLVEGDYDNLPVLDKGNAREGAAYQFAGGYMIVHRIYRISDEHAKEHGLLYLDRAETSIGDIAIPGSDTLQGGIHA
jgi:hypothetical protein